MKKDNLKIEYLPIGSLRPYDKNTRKHEKYDISQIMISIQKYGFDDPIGIWGKDNIIVEGHGRLAAAKKLHMREVPCIRLDHLTDEERREYAIMHNKTAELSEWDFDLLQAEVGELDFDGFDLDWGFKELEDSSVVEDEAPEPDYKNPPISKQGDIWQLGNHRLMCGDSTSDDVAKLMADQKADLLVTDPPYNVDYEGGTGMKIQNDSMSDTAFRKFLTDAFSNASKSIKKGADVYIWYVDSEATNFIESMKNAGLKYYQNLIWVKNSIVLGHLDYQKQHEPCLYGWKDGAGHKWYADRKQSTILEFDRPTKSDLHPTMKPVNLIAYLIRNSSKQEDIILDLFGGSGSTLMACEQLNRTCYIMEFDPVYADVIVKRWENFTHKKAVLLNGEEGKTTE